MSRAKSAVKTILFALAGAGALLLMASAPHRGSQPGTVASSTVGATGWSPLPLESQPFPVSFCCFPQNTCPPCKGKPVARSQKKEKREKCSCHRVTYQCEDGTAKTCFDNCE